MIRCDPERIADFSRRVQSIGGLRQRNDLTAANDLCGAGIQRLFKWSALILLRHLTQQLRFLNFAAFHAEHDLHLRRVCLLTHSEPRLGGDGHGIVLRLYPPRTALATAPADCPCHFLQDGILFLTAHAAPRSAHTGGGYDPFHIRFLSG